MLLLLALLVLPSLCLAKLEVKKSVAEVELSRKSLELGRKNYKIPRSWVRTIPGKIWRSVDEAEEGAPEQKGPLPEEPNPEELANLMVGVMIMDPVEADESEIMKNMGPLNTPYAGYCEKHSDCAKGFMCRDLQMDEDHPMYEKYKGKKACLLANPAIAEAFKCPALSVPTQNVFCEEDSDCPKDKPSKCIKDFVLPADVVEDIEEEEGERKKSLGICCSEEDVFPEVLAHCPADYLPSRRSPCGLGLSEECEIGSSCLSPKGMFGRCCSSPKMEAKLEDSNYWGYRRYGWGGYGRWGRGYGRWGRGFGRWGRGWGRGFGRWGRGYGRWGRGYRRWG